MQNKKTDECYAKSPCIDLALLTSEHNNLNRRVTDHINSTERQFEAMEDSIRDELAPLRTELKETKGVLNKIFMLMVLLGSIFVSSLVWNGSNNTMNAVSDTANVVSKVIK